MRQDSDLSRAHTLSSRYYLDASILKAERARIFGRTWQWVGQAASVESPGDYFTGDVGGEPMVISRGPEGRLRAFSNVCRHRAGPVASGQGCRKQFQCAYHGWSYALDGRLTKAPEMEGVEDFVVEDIRLPAFAVEEWSNLVFAKLDGPTPSLVEVMGDIRQRVDAAGIDIDAMSSVSKREYFVESNWKTYVDNFLEGYHIPRIHPALFQEIDYDRYRIDTFDYYSSQHAPLRPAADGDAGRRYLPTKDDESALHYWVYPNLMLNFYPTNLQVNLVIPLSVTRTLVIFEWFATGGRLTPTLEKDIELGDVVQDEDRVICEAVQQGLQSANYDRGRYSVERENGVHHFHELYRRSLEDSASAS